MFRQWGWSHTWACFNPLAFTCTFGFWLATSLMLVKGRTTSTVLYVVCQKIQRPRRWPISVFLLWKRVICGEGPKSFSHRKSFNDRALEWKVQGHLEVRLVMHFLWLLFWCLPSQDSIHVRNTRFVECEENKAEISLYWPCILASKITSLTNWLRYLPDDVSQLTTAKVCSGTTSVT